MMQKMKSKNEKLNGMKIKGAKIDGMKISPASQKRKGLGWLVTVVILLLLAGACVWYVNDYYHAENYVDAYLESSATVTVTNKDNIVFLDGAGTEHALVFYPGAKVEYTAYVPMFYALAEQGIDCFVVKMPGNLAILGMGRAADIMEEYSYENWYLSGHSLGGAMAASYVADNAEDFEGLVLLAAYATKALPADLKVLSVYGSEDKVLNAENLEAGRAYLPADYTELCIAGGNHAWFAYYGEQDGDGTASITKAEQQKQTVEAIVNMVLK